MRRPRLFRSPAAPRVDAPVSRELDGQQLRLGWVGPELRGRLTSGGERRLMVLHVPKTAGSSLRKMLSAHVPEDRTFLSTGQHQWANRSTAQLSGYTLFVGHSFLEPLYLLPDDDWVTVLPVREPVSWWRSYYTYRRQRKEEVATSFGDWVDGRSDLELANPQASWLVERMRLMFDNPLCPPGRVAATGTVLRDDPAAVVSLLDRLLDRLTVVGVTENLHALYLDVCNAMEWEPLHDKAVRNNISRPTTAPLALTAAQEQRMRRLNRIDQHLHDRATQLSERRPRRGLAGAFRRSGPG